MFSKLKNKLQATRFEYTLHCHSLQPWPVGNKAIAIGWQRGKRRRGATNSVFPLPSADKQGTVVRINEKFTCTATLYKAPGADKNSQTGPFKKKCIILAVLETDGRSNATAALGRVVIDLSEFASIDGTELRTFQVACNKGIHAAVGQPQLTITIRCRWKKAGADMTEDEVASMSTDTTGSNLAYNWLGNILSFGKGTARGRRDGEQDLSNTAGVAPRETMDTIGEEDADGSTKAVESSFGSGTFSEDWQHAAQAEYDVAGTLNLHDHDDDDYITRMGVQPSPASTGPSRPASTTPTPAADKSADNGRWRLEKLADSAAAASSSRTLGPPTPVPSSERQATAKAPSKRSKRRNVRTQTESSGKVGASGMPGFEDSSAMQDELLTSAALELALYNSDRPLVAAKPRGRVVHAASRRLARTLVCLGRQDGLPFGQLALAHISSRVVRHRADVAQLAYWWTNACHLRGFLQSLNLTVAPGAAGEQAPCMHWSSLAFVSKLLAQEKFIFDELVSHMWTHVLVPRISTQRATKGSAGPPLNKRAAHEAALRKWVECFEGLNATLKDLGRDGHASTLRHQVLLELLKRTDILLFHYLINPAGSVDGDRPSTPASSVHSVPGTPQARGSATGMPVLDDSMLFFGRGSLSFGTGMTLKMAVARFQQWAFSEGGLKEIWSQLPEKGQSLFTLLRGAADLLMMPKDMLLDEGIRSDVVENLPLGAVLYVVEHFQPDEYAADRIPADVKDALRRSVAARRGEEGLPDGPATPPELDVEGECTYYSPTDDMVMEKVEMGEEPGLEYDEDSEDELEALGALCSGAGTDTAMVPALRFKLLHNLWNAGVPRSRRLLSNDDAGPM